MKKVVLSEDHHHAPEGAEGERTTRDGRVMYRFDCGRGQYVSFSWDYITNHKRQFNVTKQED